MRRRSAEPDDTGDARKRAIAAAFGRAAGSYDAMAAPQRQAAALLDGLARRQCTTDRPVILEIGCGTGILTRHLRDAWPAATLTVSDIAPEMVGRAADGAMTGGSFLTMDGEAPPFDRPWFDLILSNLAFQWFVDLPLAIERLAALLKPGGSLLFSTMGADSFAEWRGAHEAVGTRAGTPDWPSLADLRHVLAPFPDAFAFEEHWSFDLGGASGLLTHFRAIGATVPASGHLPLPPSRLRAVKRAFDEAGGCATYHVLFGRVTARP